MKFLVAGLLLGASLWANTAHSAKVLESMSSGGYTYMKVKENKNTYWIAMTQRDVKVGQSVNFEEQGWMKNFKSKTLNRTFDSILFAADVQSHRSDLENIRPDIMKSAYQEKDTVSIADLFANRDKYVGKTITIKGKVTKTSTGIMKRNWVHLSDGSRFQNMDDIVFTTTKDVPKIGSIVYAKGTVEKDVDFGYGYFYPIIIQNSSF